MQFGWCFMNEPRHPLNVPLSPLYTLSLAAENMQDFCLHHKHSPVPVAHCSQVREQLLTSLALDMVNTISHWAFNFHATQCFEHPHFQTQVILNSSDSELHRYFMQTLMPHAAPSEGTESGLHADAKNCCCSKNNDPYIWNSTELWPLLQPTGRGKTHFKWLAKSCQDTSIPYCGLSSFSLPSWYYGHQWQDDKVAMVYGWGSINKRKKPIIIKWSQNPPDFTQWAAY